MNNDISKKQEAARRKRFEMIEYINLQLSALGQPVFQDNEESVTKMANEKFMELTKDLVDSYREKKRLLGQHRTPIDQRIQAFIDDYLKDVKTPDMCNLPTDTFILGKEGLARELSLPPDSNSFFGKYISTYRVKQGPPTTSAPPRARSTSLRVVCLSPLTKRRFLKSPSLVC